MELGFLGATGTVTGSRYLLESDGHRVLVDCGLFQGLKQLRLRNWAAFPVPPDSIEAVVLTHAHLDHSGYLPRLVREGFAGPAHCAAASAALCGLLLPDSAHLEEEAAAHANRHGYSKHHPALPLYTARDAAAALSLLHPVPFEQDVPLPGRLSLRLRRAGHIPGAASVAVTGAAGTIVFSGDLGRPDDPVLPPPRPFERADWLVVESTYGDRRHAAGSVREALAAIVRETAARGGALVIPAFAVGRTQTLLHHLAELRRAGGIPPLPIYIDSPMAGDVTRFLLEHAREHRLTPEQVARMRDSVTITNSVEASKGIDRRNGPMIVISASGMASGGRVLFHLERFAPDPRNTILFVGYQAAGTRGAAMVGGASSVKMHGHAVPIRASVRKLDGLSAHADADEIMSWLHGMTAAPRETFVTHGEPTAADALRLRIQDELGWSVRVPEQGERVALG